MVAPGHPPLLALVDELLAEQQRLQTPVARLAAARGQVSPSPANPRELIPFSAPVPGEQYAFEVDLDSCSGCKACVAACHVLNGLDDNESWRDVGLVHGGSRAAPYQQTITTACHHCADPGCLNGCPVLAYEKDPVTGIVRHLDDQCIGCQYCILKCPYDVPKYSPRLGIVRKCDMCHQRLAAGEAPACVQACPTHAIRIVKVEVSSTAAGRVDTSAFLPGAPDPAYTQPATRYLTRRPFPADLAAADAAALRPEPPHWPLVALLVLMPLGIGCGVADKALALPTPALAVGGWLAGATGLLLAVLHLGQPRRAWRVFLNVRRSWFSREAVVFGAWFGLATGHVAVRLGWIPLAAGGLRAGLALATIALGVLGLFCSAMIYADTRRHFWRLGNTAPRFFGTAVVLGLAGALAAGGAPPALGGALVAAMILKLAFEAAALAPLRAEPDAPPSPERKTALLLTSRPLRTVNELRVAAAWLGGMVVPGMIAAGAAPLGLAVPGLVLVLAGEVAERSLFFRAVVAPKMPGLPTARTGAGQE